MCLNIIKNQYEKPLTKKSTFGYKIIREDMFGLYSMFPMGHQYYVYTLNKWLNSHTDEESNKFPQCDIVRYNEDGRKLPLKKNQYFEDKLQYSYPSGFHSYKFLYSLVDNYCFELLNNDGREDNYWAYKIQLDEIIADGYEIGEDGYKNLVIVSKKIKLIKRISQEEIKKIYDLRSEKYVESY
jgi:hypothetical protein